MTLSYRLDAIEQEAVTLVARVAPWLAPVPTAWLVYDRTQAHLEWPWQVAAVAAVTLECLGLSASATALRARHFNLSVKYKSEAAARTWLATGLLAVYLAVAEFLTLALDVLSLPAHEIKAAHLAPALFPFLSLAGVILLAERANLARRFAAHQEAVDKNRRDRADAKARRTSAGQAPDKRHGQMDGRRIRLENQENGRTAPDSDRTMTGVTGQAPDSDRTTVQRDRTAPRWRDRRAFLADSDRPSDLTPADIVRLTGKSDRTARRWLEALSEQEKTNEAGGI